MRLCSLTAVRSQGHISSTWRPAPMRFSNAAQLCTSGCPPLLQPADAPLVSSEVLVETFEEGELISK